MSALLQQLDIFELRPLITNLSCKLSTVTQYDARRQLLCLVSEDNDIVLRYTNDIGQEVLKLISWFRRTARFIHDVSFDPTGCWLLVLCFDNTLHVVPALAVVDRTYAEPVNSIFPQQPFSSKQVTSFIIPFVGPHECPNSKKCPNHTPSDFATDAKKPTQDEVLQQLADDMQQVHLENPAAAEPLDEAAAASMEAYSHDVPEKMLKAPPNQSEDKTTIGITFMASSTCPYPLSVVWWQTGEGMQRAIIGYSDGSICFVGLSPNCPFVASTAISSGSVVKLLICKDTTFESVMLLITSSLKLQYKLLLEQKTIKYVYPGDISPTNAQARDNDWQIVMPLKMNVTSSIASDSASDHSQMDDEVFVQKKDTEEVMAIKSNATMQIRNPSCTTTTAETTTTTSTINNQQQPPPPTYAQAISRQAELSAATIKINETATTTIPTTTTIATATENTTVTLTTTSAETEAAAAAVLTSTTPTNATINTNINNSLKISTTITTTTTTTTTSTATIRPVTAAGTTEIDDYLGRAGLLPAARARLASLKSLGSKKLNALKLRLSDNRQKLSDEQIPENTQNTFAIMDSPSLTPELLNNYEGSFYTLQNLRRTYLLSALHALSNSLSVHSMDISLKPLFLYKIPKNCLDILISSNILYSIQYVDMDEDKKHKTDEQQNTEKESRDKDEEKEKKFAEIIEADMSSENDKIKLKQKQEDDAIKSVLPQLDLNNDMDPIFAVFSSDSVDSSSSTTITSSQSNNSGMTNMINAVGVISSAMASLRAGDEDRFNVASQLALFRFENETVLNLYQMATYRNAEANMEAISKEEKMRAFDYKDIKSPMDYVEFYEHVNNQVEFSLQQMEIMQQEFPKINYDPCYVVTNKNVYFIQLKKEPFAIFLDAALAGEWIQCREFCNTFNLAYETCIEFAGDYLLRRKKVTQALLTYNAARIKPIRTALKLAMFGQTCALMHLCAMALKSTYILKSKYFSHALIEAMLEDITYRHAEDVRKILPTKATSHDKDNIVVNEGMLCSNYVYGLDESISNLQMSPSSQFHLSNLLLITLAEKTVNDKNYLPLWNFIATNTKYHTNMTSIVLCQSGLFSAALLLAKVRGVCVDTFMALTSVVGQEFGWYSELNVCLYNLSETLFSETLTYVPYIADEYFRFIQNKCDQIRLCVLERLKTQLDLFSPKLRPVVSHTSSNHMALHNLNDNNTYLFEFCKSLVETYLTVIIQIESRLYKGVQIKNALSTFRINYEDNQFAIETSRFKPISAGCAHCACVVDGIAYFWGSNGIPVYYNINKSSEPPEPSHAVKSLDVLAQLNLEAHAVKCGRQHTLILTNNGLYAFGSNTLCQLGIGKHMQVSLQPMLVDALDGKNITILEVGQYHNAVVADGQLYTWGWGVYGQLGHGDVENQPKPQLVPFFKYMKVLQVSLGHAHSLVLCHGSNGLAELYVFGSNHFGQLGIGSVSVGPHSSGDLQRDDCSSQVKSARPLLLQVCAARIRLIHTKFFTNLAVDENECMYTWGSSPQVLRLANQIKRRANARQKSEEAQRREMSRRFEATMLNSETITLPTSSSAAKLINSTSNATELVHQNSDNFVVHEAQKVIFSTAAHHQDAEEQVIKVNIEELTDAEAEAEAEERDTDDEDSDEQEEAEATKNIELNENADQDKDNIDKNELVEQIAQQQIKLTAETAQQDTQKRTEEQLPIINETEADEEKKTSTSTETDGCEHTTPHLVDTSEVAGQILQISSGLFHFALISSSCTLYTWGKNLEHQLGTEDKERRAVNKPSAVDSIERPMYVDCGADFTIVMTTDYVVKAFGGNSNGQCGRDLGACIDKIKTRVVCLPTTKRLMRFETQCIEAPVEVNLPRPRIRLENEPVRYLKCMPEFREHFVQEAAINLEEVPCNEQNSLSASETANEKSTATPADSSERGNSTPEESEELISSSLGNLSQNDISSLQVSCNLSAAVEESACGQSSSYECTAEEHSYTRLAQQITPTAQKTHEQHASMSSISECASSTAEAKQYLRNYIHYCLYVFHGLYNAEKIREIASQQLEFRIRTYMLNFKFVEAFQLCLEDGNSASKTLKLFEYFTKDTGYVPLRRQDLKFFIYYLLQHFLVCKFDLLEVERFLLADLDYYLIELAYVLYFNNNNTMLEQNLNKKFQRLLAQSMGVAGAAALADHNRNEHKMQDTDVIFDCLSVKFKTIVCQRLMELCGN